jgi:hypothetical protein
MPRFRRPLGRSAPPLATGAPGHPLPPVPRRTGRTPVPGPALHGAPGRPLVPDGSSAGAGGAGRAGRAGGSGRFGAAGLLGADTAWELVILAVALACIGRLAEGPALWVASLLAGLALALAALEVLGTGDAPPAVVDLGVPVEALLLPAATGIASMVAIHVVPVGLLLVPALVVVGSLAASSIAIERRILARPSGPTAADRSALLGLVMVVAFVAFTGIAAAIPGALVEPPPTGVEVPVPGLALGGLALLAVLDGLVAGILGYRMAALEGPTVRGALAAALSYAAVIAIAAAALRAMGLPRLLGPALLTLVLYLWSAYRGVPRGARRDARWIWEVLLLAALGVLVVLWNLVAQG